MRLFVEGHIWLESLCHQTIGERKRTSHKRISPWPKWPKPADSGYQGIDNNQPITPSDQAVVEGSNGWQSSRSVVNSAQTMRLTKPGKILRTNSSDVLT
jgi:hypothetical protein